eukprot:scaffold191378_cov28-Tisochrysis_lutea.AAC.4
MPSAIIASAPSASGPAGADGTLSPDCRAHASSPPPVMPERPLLATGGAIASGPAPPQRRRAAFTTLGRFLPRGAADPSAVFAGVALAQPLITALKAAALGGTIARASTALGLCGSETATITEGPTSMTPSITAALADPVA